MVDGVVMQQGDTPAPDPALCEDCGHVHTVERDDNHPGFKLMVCDAITCGDGCCSCGCYYYTGDPTVRFSEADLPALRAKKAEADLAELITRFNELARRVTAAERSERNAVAKAGAVFLLAAVIAPLEGLRVQGVVEAFKTEYPDLAARLRVLVRDL